MAMMKLVVFDTQQGQCIFVRTPNDYGILIDCGRGSSERMASPAEWLEKNEAPSLNHYKDHPIALLIVTHPTDDNVRDIATVLQSLSPALLWCDDDYDWQAMISGSSKATDSISAYYSWLSTIEPNVEPDADLGLTVRRFSLDQDEAERLGGDMQQVVDNRSIVTVITYTSDEGYTWKVVVSGDNETKGWGALLAKPEFRKEIGEADFFITSRQGQESGFSADLFKAMGKPIANISCVHGNEEHVDKRYAKQAQGVKFPDGSRGHFMTGGDGNITVDMHDDGRYDVWLFKP